MIKQIELTILRVLNDAAPTMVRNDRLFASVNVEHPSAVTKVDFDRAIVALQQKDGGPQIVGASSEDGTKWRITAEGIARLATL